MTPDRSLILVVDDTTDNIDVLRETLRGSYRIKAATSGEKALTIAADDPRPDLILLDVMMPGMDGYQVCERLKSDLVTRDIPVIFITALTQVADEQRGFELGAVDYITKPLVPVIVLSRVRAQLALAAQTKRLKEENAALEQPVEGPYRSRTDPSDPFRAVLDRRPAYPGGAMPDWFADRITELSLPHAPQGRNSYPAMAASSSINRMLSNFKLRKRASPQISADSFVENQTRWLIGISRSTAG